MPYLTVEYTDALAATVDRPALARALHPLVAKIAGGPEANCKTRFRPVHEHVIAAEDDGGPVAWLHVEIALLSGRTKEVKRELADSALELVRAHVPAPAGSALHASVEVRDMDRDSYAGHKDAAPGAAA